MLSLVEGALLGPSVVDCRGFSTEDLPNHCIFEIPLLCFSTYCAFYLLSDSTVAPHGGDCLSDRANTCFSKSTIGRGMGRAAHVRNPDKINSYPTPLPCHGPVLQSFCPVDGTALGKSFHYPYEEVGG